MEHLQIDGWDKSLRKLAIPACHHCDGLGFIMGDKWKECSYCGGTGKKETK